MGKFDFSKIIFITFVFFIICFLFLPILISIITSFNISGMTFPPTGFTLEWYKKVFKNEYFINGIKNSLLLGVLASVLANTISLLSSFVLVRCKFFGKNFLNVFLLSPLMIPASIIGLALYTFLVPFGKAEGFYALLIGHTLILTPYATRIICASLQRFNISLEEAAMSVGANRWLVTFKITLPVIKTGIVGSMLMCFIVSWNNFAFALYLASPKFTTLPLELYSHIMFETDSVAAALVTLLVVFSWIMIAVLDRVVGISFVAGMEKS